MDPLVNSSRSRHTPRFEDVRELAIKAYSRFLLRLWMLSLIFCLSLTFLRMHSRAKISVDSNGDSFSMDLTFQIKLINSKSAPRPLYAIPALFGTIPQSDFNAPLLILKQSACDPFQIEFPSFEWSDTSSTLSNRLSETKNDKTDQTRKSTHWFAMIKRGGCAFDLKVFEAQKAGFAGVIIYTDYSPGDFEEAPVRMSPHNVGSLVSIPSMYLTFKDASSLISASHGLSNSSINTSVPILHISSVQWGILPGHSIGEILFLETFVLSIAVVLSSTIVLCICLLFLVARNVYQYQEPRLYEAIIVGSCMLLDIRREEHIPKLRKIPFPEKTLTSEDVQLLARDEDPAKKWICRDCCSICLDEFVVGSQARILPCRHVFHSSWCVLCLVFLLKTITNTKPK